MNSNNEIYIDGVEKRDIAIVDYDPSWPEIFKFHEAVISQVLVDVALRIEHMGSTGACYPL